MDRLEVITKKSRESFIPEFNNIIRNCDAEYLLVLSEESSMNDAMKRKLIETLDSNPEAVLAVPKKLFHFPDRMDGVILRLSEVINLQMKEELRYNYEADFLLRFIFGRKILLMPEVGFIQTDPDEADFEVSGNDRNKDWYIDDMNSFLLKLIKNVCDLNYGKLPPLYQFYVMHYLKCRMDANVADRNKGLFSEEEREEIIDKMREILRFVDDRVIMQCYEYPSYSDEYQYRRMMLYIKHGHFLPPVEIRAQRTKSRVGKPVAARNTTLIDSCGDMFPMDAKNMRLTGLGLMMNDVPVYSSNLLLCKLYDISFEEGVFNIKGSFTDAFDNDTFEYFMMLDKERIDIQFNDEGNERYYFGKISFKNYSFEVSFPIKDNEVKKHTLYFVIGYQDREYIIPFEFSKMGVGEEEHTAKFCRQYKDWLVSTAEYTVLGDTNALPSQIVSNEDCLLIEKSSWLKKAGKVITRQMTPAK